MKVTFYGVRGSIPSPGSEFARYGGNTACTHVELNDGTHIILDSGTGIKKLGNKLVKENCDIHLMLSHNHWDHIQGFPFFLPIYQPGRVINIYPGLTTYHEDDAILKQMSNSLFPVCYTSLQSHISIHHYPEDIRSWSIGSAKVTRHVINHPGCGSAYVIEADGKKLAYLTDNELNPPYHKQGDFLDWSRFTKDVDLLIHDAQYLPQDMPMKHGWGHSLAEEAVKLAMAAQVKMLALYSHDHMRTDDEIDKINDECHELIQAAQSTLICFPAHEGQEIEL